MFRKRCRKKERFTYDFLNDIINMVINAMGDLSVWKYSELDAYKTIGLHDCKSDFIKIDEGDLIFNFPAGFKLCPGNRHNKYNFPVMTGKAQLCFHGLYDEMEFDCIYVYKNVRLFRKTLFCRRIKLETKEFIEFFKEGKYELEFLAEWHAPMSFLYKCLICKKGSERTTTECEIEITARNIEYRWNEIKNDDAS